MIEARQFSVPDTCDEALASSALRSPARRPETDHVFHQYVVRAANRADLRLRLNTVGFATAVHYPLPVHRQPAYFGRFTLGPSQYRVTEDISGQVVSLPTFPELTDAQVEHVCNALRHR